MSREKDVLIQNTDSDNRSQISLRYTLIVPILILFYLPAEIMVYIGNEWIQQTVTTEQFPNASLYTKSPPCKTTNQTDETAKDYKHVETITSRWLLYNKLAVISPLIFTIMILSSYSDSYGRKFSFIMAMIGLFMKDILITTTIYFGLEFWVVTIAYGIEGLTGGSTAIINMAFASIADLTTTSKNRVLGIVAIEAVIVLAGLCPGFVAGYMVQSHLGYTFSAILCSSTMSIAVIVALLFLPETLPPERRVPPKPVWSTIKRTFDFYTSNDFKGKRMFYLILLITYAVSCIAGNNRTTMETLYFLNQPFCWNPINFGYFTLVKQISKAIFGTLTLRPLQKCIPNEVILVLTATSTLASYIIEALARTVLIVYASAVIGSLTFLNTPLIKGLMSAMTSTDKQGSLFASVSVISEISSLVSYFTTNLVYDATLSVMNGFVFLVMAGFNVLQVILLIVFCCKTPKAGISETLPCDRA